LLQRLLQILQQSRILDCNDCLFCEIAQQRNLLFSERLDFLTIDRDSANQLAGARTLVIVPMLKDAEWIDATA
jgi:hypothetical protein